MKLIIDEKLKIIFLLISFAIPILPQLIYWKYITGNWLFFSYVGERFYFNQPHFYDCMFSFTKGWLVYTPIMIFALLGFLLLKRYASQIAYSSIATFAISFYIVICWWCWWYGGSFGMRPFVDFYGLLALPMGAFYQYVYSKKPGLKISLLIVVFSFSILNIFQTYQYKSGVMHYDGNTKETYWLIFGKTQIPPGFWESIKQPDPDKAKQGLPAL